MMNSAAMGTSNGMAPPARAPRTMKTITSIQYLRALACIAVVVFHATEDLGGAFNIGQTGVDLFFVLSGLLVTQAWLRTPTWSAYLRRRAWRVIPAYYVTLLLGGCLVLLFSA